jgi:fluoride exporter
MRELSMVTYFWVAVGSALGGIARNWCTFVAAKWLGTAFPWGTLFINILGSFVIGLFFTITGVDGRLEASTDMKAFVMVGICGGYTTFSAFSLQTLSLALDGQWLRAGAYILGSVVLCLLGVWAGHALAAAVNAAGPGA